MSRENMLATTFRRFQAGLGRAIRRIAPRRGFLDTIFDSYDDWRELQAQQPAELSKKGNTARETRT
jgi:hypothetical protein